MLTNLLLPIIFAQARAGIDYESSYGKVRANDTILKLQRTTPYYKRNRAHVCSFYVRGECTRGAECPYRHEMPETGELSQQNIKDRYYGYVSEISISLYSYFFLYLQRGLFVCLLCCYLLLESLSTEYPFRLVGMMLVMKFPSISNICCVFWSARNYCRIVSCLLYVCCFIFNLPINRTC